MIHTEMNGCRIDILPIIKGLVSEYDRVKGHITDDYDCIAVSLSIEDIEIYGNPALKDLEYDPSDFDSVYAHFLGKFGEIDVPVPAYRAVTDACKEKELVPFPLEMCDEDFTKAYCNCVKIGDMLKEKRLLKKAMKHGFDMTSPETFVKEWDTMMSAMKGHNALALLREEHMAKEIADLTRYKRSILAVIELERVDGVIQELGEINAL